MSYRLVHQTPLWTFEVSADLRTALIGFNHQYYTVLELEIGPLLDGGPEAVERWIAVYRDRYVKPYRIEQKPKKAAATHTAKNNKYLVRREAEYAEQGYPLDVAIAQASYDLNCLCARAWRAGATLKVIAKYLNRSPAVVAQRIAKHDRFTRYANQFRHTRLDARSPIEQWAQSTKDFR